MTQCKCAMHEETQSKINECKWKNGRDAMVYKGKICLDYCVMKLITAVSETVYARLQINTSCTVIKL